MLASALSTANAPSLTRYQYTQLHMGVQVRIVVYAPSQAMAEKACAAAFHRFAQLDEIMSDYRATSELMRLCAKAGGPPVPVSEELFRVLEFAQEVSRRSEGAFDVTVGPMVALWRKARRSRQFPTQEELAQARALVGWQKVKLDAEKRTVQISTPGMRLDLGGIAKGYAGDEAQAVLKRHGITRALVEAGGDIVVSGPPPDKPGWEIQLMATPGDPSPRTLALSNVAISTSGDTEQYVEFGGKRYSHIVDPRTGLGLTDRVVVTVLAPNGITSDSLSTTISVLGAEKGKALAKTYPGVTAIIRR